MGIRQHPTLDQLTELKLHGLARAFTELISDRQAEQLAHPHSFVLALVYSPPAIFRREAGVAQATEDKGLALARELGFPMWVAIGSIYRGWAIAEQDRPEEDIDLMRQGLVNYQATGAEAYRTQHLALLAEVYGKVDQAEEGLDAVAEAQVAVSNTGERWYEAELYRLKGELTLQESKVESQRSQVEEEAAAYFHKAIAIAQKQEAKSWELRAATSLARLWQQQGKGAEARALLAPVYEWFTEGFDTADLQDAKTLLEKLS